MATAEGNNIKEASPSGSPSSRYIHLNVGGTTYMTSQETLTRYQDSMLGNMFLQENIPLAKDEQGRFLIDRDGTLFRYILNFLRNGELILPSDSRECDQLLAEAKFYGLDELVTRMSIHLNVNGVHYTTTKTILTQHSGSMLTGLFSEKPIPLERDQGGRYLINGDGELFQYVLNFLEYEDLHLPPRFEKFEELNKEAERYNLKAMRRTLNVSLNVGGHEFNSSRATLTSVKGSLLEEIFTQTPIPLERDELGRYVIQQDGHLFKHILNYLQNGRWQQPVLYRDMQPELDYYKLEENKSLMMCHLRIGYSCHYAAFDIAWKNLTKYKGSLLEEMFTSALIGSGSGQLNLSYINVDRNHIEYVIKFLETENLAEVPPSSYHKLLEIARYLRLEELQRQLNNHQQRQM